MVPVRCINNFESTIFKLVILSSLGICCEIAFWLIPENLTDEKSTLVQVMDWCHGQQAITITNIEPDIYHHLVSLTHRELIVTHPASICDVIS